MMDPYERTDRAVLRGLRLFTFAIAIMTGFIIHAVVTAPVHHAPGAARAAR